ncbi:hypothetical protein ASE68_00920 [Agromyces sp. Leaf222]|nr:hypothetical protein ASE68_00920 [Agromyces sp. Leaf222]
MTSVQLRVLEQNGAETRLVTRIVVRGAELPTHIRRTFYLAVIRANGIVIRARIQGLVLWSQVVDW